MGNDDLKKTYPSPLMGVYNSFASTLQSFFCRLNSWTNYTAYIMVANYSDPTGHGK